MKIINKKQCPNPKCKSFNVSDTGKKWSSVGDLGPNGEYKEQDFSINKLIYKCNDCNKKINLVQEKMKENF
jgi:hypothetical protein